MDFSSAFILTQSIGLDYLISANFRTTARWCDPGHRLVALVLGLALLAPGWQAGQRELSRAM